MSKEHPMLFSPFKLKHLTLKNRIVKPAQWVIYAEPDCSVGPRVIAFYESIARGGVGLVTVEESICEYPEGASNVPHIRLDEDRFIPGLSELAKTIHKFDVPCFVQITHAGPAHNSAFSGTQPVAPSRLDPPAEPQMAIARELTLPEIKGMVEKFAQAALRVKKAGFDGVELHMAHYALVNAFLSRVQNKRHDEYGCDTLENRARFSIEILQRVRELCGPDFVIGVRLSTKEWGHDLGTTVEEACQFARMFEKASCDYIQASNYGYGPFGLAAIPEMVLYPEVPDVVKPYADRKSTGYIIPEAAEIKKAVSIPVSGVGRLDAEIGEKILAEGKVDLVCLGRRLFADPNLPNKTKDGHKGDVKPCLGCLYCLHVMLFNQPVACRVNPFMGRELEMEIKPADKKKKVMVVGAGPAGMEAARVAALRGHQVTLYDKAKELGGLLPMASFIKGKNPDDLDELLDYYKAQFESLGVKVELGKEVSPEMVGKFNPDAVILAVGGKPIPPAIPCNEKKLVTTEELKAKSKDFVRLLGADWMNSLTKIFLPVGEKVVVVGADLAGLEAAEFLVKRGKQVTIVDEAEQPGEGMLIQWLLRLMPWLAGKGVQIIPGIKYEAITSEGMVITTKEGERKTLPADTVMWINKYTKNPALFDALQGKVSELHLIGDGGNEKPAYIHGAILDGAQTALRI